jgi:hypothetical protein
MPEEYQEYVQEQPVEVVAPAPMMPRQWSWSTDKLLWAAGIALVLGFGIYFVMSFTGARARFLAEAVTSNDGASE